MSQLCEPAVVDDSLFESQYSWVKCEFGFLDPEKCFGSILVGIFDPVIEDYVYVDDDYARYFLEMNPLDSATIERESVMLQSELRKLHSLEEEHANIVNKLNVLRNDLNLVQFDRDNTISSVATLRAEIDALKLMFSRSSEFGGL